jgi:hypothetical protein
LDEIECDAVGSSRCNTVAVGISSMNLEFQKIFLFLGRTRLKGIPQNAERGLEYFSELSCRRLKNVSSPE